MEDAVRSALYRPAQADGEPNPAQRRRTRDTETQEPLLARIRETRAEPPLGHIGAYEVLAEAGRGAQGVVYRARRPGTSQDVALKRLVAGSFVQTRKMILLR